MSMPTSSPEANCCSSGTRSALRKNRRLVSANAVKIDNFFAELKRRNVYKVTVQLA
jgi:hypothetical protein